MQLISRRALLRRALLRPREVEAGGGGVRRGHGRHNGPREERVHVHDHEHHDLLGPLRLLAGGAQVRGVVLACPQEVRADADPNIFRGHAINGALRDAGEVQHEPLQHRVLQLVVRLELAQRGGHGLGLARPHEVVVEGVRQQRLVVLAQQLLQGGRDLVGPDVGPGHEQVERLGLKVPREDGAHDGARHVVHAGLAVDAVGVDAEGAPVRRARVALQELRELIDGLEERRVHGPDPPRRRAAVVGRLAEVGARAAAGDEPEPAHHAAQALLGRLVLRRALRHLLRLGLRLGREALRPSAAA
mmetsp:Transcript_44699/g.140173  ORF Transcript_44699/g.140173 Transcript_44699/m.140173 type:complete len:302 (+) Transcript_44699:834-1739(+)